MKLDQKISLVVIHTAHSPEYIFPTSLQDSDYISSSNYSAGRENVFTGVVSEGCIRAYAASSHA